MRYLVLPVVLAAALVLGAPAQAGGWATVGFAPLPDGTGAGEAWRPEITVLQHGQTPLGGLSPLVTIEEETSGALHTFTATETSTTGVYRADVVFPSAGSWRIAVDSGFGDSRVTYGPLVVGGGVVAASPGSFPAVPVVAAVGGVFVLVLLGLLAAQHLRRPTPASG